MKQELSSKSWSDGNSEMVLPLGALLIQLTCQGTNWNNILGTHNIDILYVLKFE